MRIGMLMAAGVIAVSGCTFSGGSLTVSKDDLDTEVAKSITPDEAGATVKADCAGELDGKVGAEQQCHVDVGDQKADVRLRVTSVKDDEVRWSTQPFLSPEIIGDSIQQDLDSQGIAVESVDCDSELVGKLGETATCATTGAEAPGDLTVEVTGVDGLLINFKYASA
jgi:hypothetical protein